MKWGMRECKIADMWKRETLLVFMTSLRFVFLVHGIFQDNYSEQKPADNAVVLTFKTEYNDIIDCVDAYKQPAFQNPLLRNHMLQWLPTTIPIELNNESLIEQVMPKNLVKGDVTCPVNTIPIRRSIQKSPQIENGDLLYRFGLLKMIHYPNDMFKGACTYINANNPRVEYGQNSGASIWICSDLSDQKNCIKAGWMVYPEIYGDSKTRFSIYWTSDSFHQTGCYDLLCSGFVQVHRFFELGSPCQFSRHGDPIQYNPFVYVFQDAATQDWWLVTGSGNQKAYVGYWPKEILPRLSQGGTVLHFGGSVMTQEGQKFPPMGDGYFPDGDMRDSNYFQQIHYVNESYCLVPPRSLGVEIYTDNPNCYGLIYEENGKGALNFGHALFMGGPGGKC